MGLLKTLKKIQKVTDPVGASLRQSGEKMLGGKAPGAQQVDPARAALQARVNARMSGRSAPSTPAPAAPTLRPSAPRAASPYAPVQVKSQGFGRKK